jgi:hypothetical protein
VDTRSAQDDRQGNPERFPILLDRKALELLSAKGADAREGTRGQLTIWDIHLSSNQPEMTEAIETK